MIKYLIIDARLIDDCLSIISNLLQLRNIEDTKKLIPVVLAKIDDYRVDSGIWDVLGMNMHKDAFEKLDYETISYVVENVSEDIQLELNRVFNLPNNTFYSFHDWIGDDIKLEVYSDY